MPVRSADRRAAEAARPDPAAKHLGHAVLLRDRAAGRRPGRGAGRRDAGGRSRWATSAGSARRSRCPPTKTRGGCCRCISRRWCQGERLYVAQPGVRSVECLSSASGRKLWSAVLPEVVGTRRPVGPAVDRPHRGRPAGTGRCRRQDAVALCGRRPATAFSSPMTSRCWSPAASASPNQNDKWQMRLTWLDPATGQAGGDDRAAEPRRERSAAGSARALQGPAVHVLRPRPARSGPRSRRAGAQGPGRPAARAAETATDPWRQRLPAELTAGDQRAARRLAARQRARRRPHRPRRRSPRRAQRARPAHAGGWPIVLARELTIPKQGNPRLRLRDRQRRRPALEARSPP